MAHYEENNDVTTKTKSSGCRKFATVEKILFIIAICGFIVCITLLVGLGVMVAHHKNCNSTSFDKIQKRNTPTIRERLTSANKSNENSFSKRKICYEVCSTSKCQSEALLFLTNMNKYVDPCDDFYQFACGNFKKNTMIPDDQDNMNLLSITQKKVVTELIEQINEEIKIDDLNAFKKMKTYYQNCINEARIQEEGTSTLLEILNDLGGWPVLLGNKWKENNYTWIENVYKIIDYGFSIRFPTEFHLVGYPKNTTIQMIKIINPLTTVSRTYMLDGLEGKLLQAYYNYMVDFAVMLGANRSIASKEMKECLNFEINLYKIKSPVEELMNIKATYNPMSVKELSEKYPSVPWLELLNRLFLSSNVSIDENEIVSVDDPKFMQQLGKFINDTTPRTIANYLIWKVVKDSVDYLPDVFLDRQLAFWRAVRGIKERKERQRQCVSDVMNIFPISLGSLYVRKHFSKDLKNNAFELVQNVKGQFKKILEEVDWMDDETKKSALEKLNAMNVIVGYADELFDDKKVDKYYDDLTISQGSYIKGALNISKFVAKQYYETLRKPVNKLDWKTSKSAAIINAYYYPQKNSIEIPAGILREPYFHLERPNYLNYGAIGSIIGHEITHGFDNRGRKFDKNGNEIDWWKPSTNEKYIQKANCMVQQYNNYTVEEVGLKLNGNRTQGENIADSGGYETAYKAYNEWSRFKKEPCLPGLEYTPQQMFWIAAANNWCSKERTQYLRDIIMRGQHSPNVARIIIPFSNNRQFAMDFGCPFSSNMNPINKCVVW